MTRGAMTRVTVKQVRLQLAEIGENVADMRGVLVRLGERSDWRDPRLTLLAEDIRFWEQRLVELRRQLHVLEGTHETRDMQESDDEMDRDAPSVA